LFHFQQFREKEGRDLEKKNTTLKKRNRFEDKLGANIRDARVKAGLTQEAFCEKYNYSRPNLAKIESGRKDIRASEVKWFAAVLNVSADYLLELSPASSTDKDVQAVAKEYGLNDGALETLKDMAKLAQGADIPGAAETLRQLTEISKDDAAAVEKIRKDCEKTRREYTLCLAALNAILSNGPITLAFMKCVIGIMEIGEAEYSTPGIPRNFPKDEILTEGFSVDKIIYNMDYNAMRHCVAASLCGIICSFGDEYYRLIGEAKPPYIVATTKPGDAPAKKPTKKRGGK